jgi:hypothetical protein
MLRLEGGKRLEDAMKAITKWLTAGATISLLSVSPVLASDMSIDAARARQLREQAPERASVKTLKRDTTNQTAKRVGDVRPCCVAHGGAVYDHLRG